ncbi:MAG: radical SAM family heme chaperone HemW [Acidobacteriota bacterium]|nr:radical SAM family heme chaperone HemW [Acidobacteriota bacterium]
MIINPVELQNKIRIKEKSRKAGAYFHYPFCPQKCPYCHFYSFSGGKEEQDAWLATIQEEISLLAGELAGLIEIDTVYFGGGTPSSLAPEEIELLLLSLKKNFSSDVKEVTLEFNPENPLEKLQDFKQAGINRLSLGAQSFSDKILESLGRLHSAGDIFESVSQARRAGLTNINLDLMIGLPGEEVSIFRANLQGIKAVQPEHLAVYMLEEIEEVPFKKNWEKNPVPEDDLATTYQKYQDSLWEMNYQQYEISNYARPGYFCQHNLKYWEYKPVVGFGPSAASHLGFVRWQNVPDLKLWSEAITNGQMHLAEYLILSPEAALKEKLMSGLRLAAGINWELIRQEFPKLDFRPYEARIHELTARGSLEKAGPNIRIKASQFLIANSILSELLF